MDILALSDKAYHHQILQDLFFTSWIAFGLGWFLHFWLQRKLPNMHWQQAGKVPTYQVQNTDLLGAFLLTLPYCLNLLLPYAEKPSITDTSNTSLTVSFLILLGAAGIVLAIYNRRGVLSDALGLLPKNPAQIISWSVLGYIAIFLSAIMLDWLGLSDWLTTRLGERQNQEIVNEVLNASDTTRITILVIGACIIAPIAEEIIFRGYLYPTMKHFTGPYLAALVTGIIFGSIHGEVWAVITLSLFGILLAALYEWSGSIYTCMVTHCIFNTVNITLMLNPHLMQQAQ